MRKGKVAMTAEQVILRGLEQGMTKRSAAALAGIVEQTFYEWVRENPEFASAVEQARAKFVASSMKVIKGHASTLHKVLMQQHRADPEFQPLVEKVEHDGYVIVKVVRDGDPKHTPPGPPP